MAGGGKKNASDSIQRRSIFKKLFGTISSTKNRYHRPTLFFPYEMSQVAPRETGIEQDEAAVEAVWTRRDRNLHRSLRRGVRRRILSAGDWFGGT